MQKLTLYYCGIKGRFAEQHYIIYNLRADHLLASPGDRDYIYRAVNCY